MASKPISNPKGSKKKKLSLKDKIHRHITDKNDVITDEDIKNVEVGVEESSEKSYRLEDEITERTPTEEQI